MPAANPPMANVSMAEVNQCWSENRLLRAPMVKKANPVRPQLQTKGLAMRLGKNQSRTKLSSGIAPTRRKAMKVTVAAFHAEGS